MYFFSRLKTFFSKKNEKVILTEMVLNNERGTGCWRWNIETNKLIWSDGLKRIYNITHEDTSKYMEKNHPDDISMINDHVLSCLINGVPYEIEHRIVVDNKIKYLIGTGMKIKDIMYGSVIDITKSKETEFKLQKLLDVKNQFVNNMTHEIRTPINGINGMVCLLKTTDVSAEQSGYIDILNESSNLLLENITCMLEFSNLENNKLSVDISSVETFVFFEEVFQEYKSKKLEFTYTTSKFLPQIIKIDKEKVRSVLKHILNNAFKFTDNGTVKISIENFSIDKSMIILLKDTGIGIDPDHINRIFIPFEQLNNGTKKTHQGSGIGLSITKSLVKLLNGSISITSDGIGLGCEVSIAIPLSV
jgi:signal transduction histidine kinase